MRHRTRAGTLGRTSSHRTAMYRNMVTSLLDHERIETTDAKAKEVRRLAERMITLGKRGDLHARRRALRVIRNRKVAAKVFDDLAERFRDRPGGYTRVIKLRNRAGDAAALSIVELVESASAAQTRGKGKKTAAKKGETAAETRKKAAPRKKAVGKKASADEATASKKKTSKKKTAKKAKTEKKAEAKTASKKKTTAKKKTKKKTAAAKKTSKKK